jgi:hypothetical protein
MRIVDQGWLEILHRTREGLCTKEDIAEIRHLVLTDPSCNIPDFSSCPWRDAILITPRNSVRSRWNKLSVIKHCEYYHNVLYIIPPEETLDEEPLSMQQRLITAQMPMDQTEHLPAYVYLSLGMKVMVTCNIATTVNLANGSRGTIVDIILDPRESQLVTTNNTVHLRFPPALVVLQLDFTEFPIVPGLRQGEAPLFPITKKFKIGKPSVSVQRRQLALTPAYAFTDFKSQGQTINHVIVDLGKTVQFSLSPFNAYVALSRSKGRDTIRLLRDFEDKLFTRHPSEDLREEELRLTKLAERTKRDYYEGKYGTCEY